MRLKPILNKILCLLPIYLVACSAGTNSTSSTSSTSYSSGTNQDLGYLMFSESNITMKLGSTTNVILSQIDGTTSIPGAIYFTVYKSGIITLTPEFCYLDYNQNPPSCTININAIGIGSTAVGTSGIGQTLRVTVVN